MSIFPTRASGSAEYSAASRSMPSRSAPGRGLAAVAGLSLLAGLSSAVVGLIGQAWTTTRSIEKAALAAALADGTLVPPSVPGGTVAQQQLADHLVHVRLPQGDGVYRPGGSPPGTDVDPSDRPLTLVMLGDSTSVGYGVRTADELPGVIIARGVGAHLEDRKSVV